MAVSKYDYAIVILYFIICLIVGFKKRTNITNIRDFGVGDRDYTNLVLLTTIVATDIGASSSIGVIQAVYKYGIMYAVAQLFVVLSWYAASIIFPKGIYKFSKCISFPDIIDTLYGRHAKYIAASLSILMTISIIAAQISGIGLIFKYLLGLNYYFGVAIGVGVILVYSIAGGIKAVTWTDYFQFFVLVVAIPLSYSVVYKQVGGLLPIFKVKASSFQDDIGLIAEPSFIIGILLYKSLPGVNIAFMQRVLMADSYIQLKSVLKNVALISFLFSIILCAIALSLRTLLKESNEESVFFLYIAQFIPTGIKGIVIAGLLAIIMSSADSWLNSASTIIARNFFKDKFVNISSQNEVTLARVSMLMICVIAFVISLYKYKITDLLFVAVNFWNPILLAPTLAGFLDIKVSRRIFYYSAVSGVTGVLVSYFAKGKLDGLSLFMGVLCSSTIILIAWAKNKKNNYKLVKEYE